MDWITRFSHAIGLTRPEGAALSVLVLLFVVGTGLRFVLEMRLPIDEAIYREEDSLFAVRSRGLPGAGKRVVVGPSGAVRMVTAGDTFSTPARRAIPAVADTDSTGIEYEEGDGGPIDAALGVEGPPGMNVNRASAAQLQRLPGIGPVLAGRIVEYRSRIGGFDRVAALRGVSGIGPRTLERIRSHLFVETDSSSSRSDEGALPASASAPESGDSAADSTTSDGDASGPASRTEESSSR